MEEFEIYEFESVSGKKFERDVQEKINYVLSRVLSWYPDKIIESLNKNHRKLNNETRSILASEAQMPCNGRQSNTRSLPHAPKNISHARRRRIPILQSSERRTKQKKKTYVTIKTVRGPFISKQLAIYQYKFLCTSSIYFYNKR